MDRGRIGIALVVALLLVAAGVAAVVVLGGTEPPVGDEEDEPDRMPLTGVETEQVPERPALIVKVSNSPEARPQTGLDVADVVIEELTEGGVTRFFTVFHSELPEIAGPVRSARPVDVQLMGGFGHPGFASSGARAEVRALLADAAGVPITEGAPGFFRDDGEYASHPVAPHDLFLRLEDGLEAVVDAGADDLEDLGWAFADTPPDTAAGDEGGAVDGADVDVVMSPSFTSSWRFDEDTGLYRRSQNGEEAAVTGGGRIEAANVVVLEVRHYVGDSGYPESDVVGSGDGLVLRDGERYPVTWTKPSDTDPLLLLDEAGEEAFPLKPGQTWIHLPEELPGT